MKNLTCLFFALFLMAGFAHSAETVVLEKPKVIADSLPWFAVREINDANSPFTRTFLEKIAVTSERTALVYFATWCAPCKDGIKRLVKSKELLAEKGIQVVLVNVGVREQDEKKIVQWVKQMGADGFKLVYDPFKSMTEKFGLTSKDGEIALPKTLLLDKNAKPLYLFGQEGSDWPQILWNRK